MLGLKMRFSPRRRQDRGLSMGAYESHGKSLQFESFSGLDSDWGPRYEAVNVVTDPTARCCGLYICFGSPRISSVYMVLFISAPGRQ